MQELPEEMVRFFQSFPSTRLNASAGSILIRIKVDDIIKYVLKSLSDTIKGSKVYREGDEIVVEIPVNMPQISGTIPLQLPGS